MIGSDDVLALPFFGFETREGAYEAVADALTASVLEAHETGRRARIALSGGSSPAPAYTVFASRELDWSRVDIALVDDRWVDLDDTGSNEAMVRHVFQAADGVTIYGMKTSTPTPFVAETEVDVAYSALRPFDAIVMGMGPDAHTASWFSGSPQLGACIDRDNPRTVLGVDASAAAVASPYPLRMTMTLPPVSEAQQIVFLLFGDDKKQVLSQALATDVTQAPINAIIEAATEQCLVIWAL
jgi:6-phosphogluconolactonase